MIHKYKYKDINIVVDVNSGSIHIVDNIAFDLLEATDERAVNNEHINLLKSRYGDEAVKSCLLELNELKEAGTLFSEPINIDGYKKEPVVKALCFHISHDCNLKCKYCFAGEGEYHGDRSLMGADVGKAAIDFLADNSGARKNLEVDFFGGEPTINFGVVKEIVNYAKTKSKNFRFTLTTNGYYLTDDIIDFSNEHMYNVVLSIDGRPTVHNKMRPCKNGGGSYNKVLENITRFAEKREFNNYYVRGTFTKFNIDFSKDVVHLADLGFKNISIEPVVAAYDAPYALRLEDAQAICAEYDKLTDIMLKRDDFSFFHFNIDLTGGSCIYKRVSGCGAGCEYMSVTPSGDLYPCHQFTGLEQFKMGTVFSGADAAVSKKFAGINVFEKKECNKCWAKFYCSGGCAANSYAFGGDISANYELGCILHRKRVECAIYLQAVKMMSQ